VLAVVAFHVDPALVPSGSLGVEVFFVLSGFLITRLLLAEHARTGTVRLRGFYARRLRRLMPALVLLVLAQTVVLGVHGRLSGAYAADAARALSYTDDLFLGYGGTRGPFALTWSLSIEEQFYLLWPAVLLALLARLRRSGRRGGSAAGAGAGPAGRAGGRRAPARRARGHARRLAHPGAGDRPGQVGRPSVLQLLSAAPAGAGGVDVAAAAGRQTGCRHGGRAARGRPGLSLGRAAIPATTRVSPRAGPSRP